MSDETINKVASMTAALCEWVEDKCKNGGTSEEVESLPNVIKGIVELVNSRAFAINKG